MAARTFIDTNVLVYAFDGDAPAKQAIAQDLLTGPMIRDLVLSTQVLLEFYAVVTRKLASPLDPDCAAAAVDRFARLRVVGTDAGLVREAIATVRRYQLSVWDALIVEAAVRAGCARVLTEDLADGSSVRGVTIENPFRG